MANNYTNLKNNYMYGHTNRKLNYFKKYHKSYENDNINNDENELEDPIFTGFTLSINELHSPLFSGGSAEKYINAINNYNKSNEDSSINGTSLSSQIEQKLKTINRDSDYYSVATLEKFNTEQKIGYGNQESYITDNIDYGAIEYIYMVDKFLKTSGTKNSKSEISVPNKIPKDPSEEPKSDIASKSITSKSTTDNNNQAEENEYIIMLPAIEVPELNMTIKPLPLTVSEIDAALYNKEQKIKEEEEKLFDLGVKTGELISKSDNIEKRIKYLENVNESVDIFIELKRKANEMILDYIESESESINMWYIYHDNIYVDEYGKDNELDIDNLYKDYEELMSKYEQSPELNLKRGKSDITYKDIENINANWGSYKYDVMTNLLGYNSFKKLCEIIFFEYDEYYSDGIDYEYNILTQQLLDNNKELYGEDKNGIPNTSNNASDDSIFGKYYEQSKKVDKAKDDYEMFKFESFLKQNDKIEGDKNDNNQTETPIDELDPNSQSYWTDHKGVKNGDDIVKNISPGEEELAEITVIGTNRQKKSEEAQKEVTMSYELTDDNAKDVTLSSNSASQSCIDLLGFINGIKKITEKYPYILQTVSGLDDAYKNYFKNSEPYQGSGENKISINCYESIDLKVSSMFNKYFNAVYDRQYKRERVPINLRRFECSIFVHDIRNFRHALRLLKNNSFNEDNDMVDSKILEIALNHLSVVEFKFFDCEIIPEETGNIFDTLNNAELGEQRMTTFAFTYGNCIINFLPFEDLVTFYKTNGKNDDLGDVTNILRSTKEGVGDKTNTNENLSKDIVKEEIDKLIQEEEKIIGKEIKQKDKLDKLKSNLNFNPNDISGKLGEYMNGENYIPGNITLYDEIEITRIIENKKDPLGYDAYQEEMIKSTHYRHGEEYDDELGNVEYDDELEIPIQTIIQERHKHRDTILGNVDKYNPFEDSSMTNHNDKYQEYMIANIDKNHGVLFENELGNVEVDDGIETNNIKNRNTLFNNTNVTNNEEFHSTMDFILKSLSASTGIPKDEIGENVFGKKEFFSGRDINNKLSNGITDKIEGEILDTQSIDTTKKINDNLSENYNGYVNKNTKVEYKFDAHEVINSSIQNIGDNFDYIESTDEGQIGKLNEEINIKENDLDENIYINEKITSKKNTKKIGSFDYNSKPSDNIIENMGNNFNYKNKSDYTTQDIGNSNNKVINKKDNKIIGNNFKELKEPSEIYISDENIQPSSKITNKKVNSTNVYKDDKQKENNKPSIYKSNEIIKNTEEVSEHKYKSSNENNSIKSSKTYQPKKEYLYKVEKPSNIYEEIGKIKMENINPLNIKDYKMGNVYSDNIETTTTEFEDLNDIIY